MGGQGRERNSWARELNAGPHAEVNMDMRENRRLDSLKEIQCRAGGREFRALLANVSVGGCKIIAFDALLDDGCPIYLKLDEGICSFGRVAWCTRDEAGISFDEQLDGACVLRLGYYCPFGRHYGKAVDRQGRPLSRLVREHLQF